MSHSKTLTATTTTKVRFNETDSLGITWHGHYVTYFEDGREAFGTAFGLHYLDIFNNGFVGHVSVAEPVEKQLRDMLVEVCKEEKIK